VIDAFVDEYLRGILNSTLGAEADVRILRERHAHLDTARLAERIVGEAVTRSGQIGAATGALTLLPVLRSSLLAMAVALDAALLLREQLLMLIQLSYLHDPDKARAEREMEAIELFARHASDDELPTSPVPAVAGHYARTAFKHLMRRLFDHVWRKFLSLWLAIPMSLIISAKVDRDATAELGEFAAFALARQRR